jgi:CDP-paratose 2-epimerase
MMTYLVTGGAGFVGSNLAIRLKRNYAGVRVIAVDNLRRRGSELNVPRLKEHGVEFTHGDVRCLEDLNWSEKIDLILECSAEPSVLAGYGGSPEYVINTNLVGLLNCLEVGRRNGSGIIFISTSRVYPFRAIDSLEFVESSTRYELVDQQGVRGVSSAGITEEFPLNGNRSLYGATKLAGELMLQEYLEMYGLRGIINRCGVLTGAWQMGKVEQGFVTLWAAQHVFGGSLSYIGYGGKGKQVRDVLHIEDFFHLIDLEIQNLDKLNGEIFNVGGGRSISVSLQELTTLCKEASGNCIPIKQIPENRPADLRIYLTDNRKVQNKTGWAPSISPAEIVAEIVSWICDHQDQLRPLLL